MWYDPFWCVWRYKTKQGVNNRNKRQQTQISAYELSDDSTDTEQEDNSEPPHKIQKVQ